MSQEWLVDPSILIKAYIIQPESARVDTLIAGLGQKPADIIHVPEFCLLECTNILWKYVQFGNMSADFAQQQIQALLDLPLTVHQAAPDLARALEIGITHHLAIYDSLYLALAERLYLPLITADIKQSKFAQLLGITLKSIADFPEYEE